MSKWRIWNDQYWGDDWNDRCEISNPEFEGIELDNNEVVQYLLDLYATEVKDLVEIDDNEDYVQALLTICCTCEEAIDKCQCEDTGEELPYTYVGFHATKV